MPKNSELYDLIARIKYEHGVTQAEIAGKIGVSKPYLSDMVNGRVPYTDSTRKKLLSAYLDEEPQEEVKQEEEEADEAFPMVPLLPLLAQGGKLNDFTTSVHEYDCERIISPVRGAQLAISVSGDSMAPEYPAGCQVLIKKIDERKFIEWGRAYVIDTVNGVVIKYLAPSDRGDGWVRCLSLNPEPRYAPFDVNLEDVFGIYRVLICMSTK